MTDSDLLSVAILVGLMFAVFVSIPLCMIATAIEKLAAKDAKEESDSNK